jgi:hypothetical protein
MKKHRLFNRELVARGIVDRARLLALVDRTEVAEPIRERIRAAVVEDFSRAGKGQSREFRRRLARVAERGVNSEARPFGRGHRTQ